MTRHDADIIDFYIVLIGIGILTVAVLAWVSR